MWRVLAALVAIRRMVDARAEVFSPHIRTGLVRDRQERPPDPQMDGVGGRVGDANVDSSGDPAPWISLCAQVWTFPQVSGPRGVGARLVRGSSCPEVIFLAGMGPPPKERSARP